jgi:hypothetical protein
MSPPNDLAPRTPPPSRLKDEPWVPPTAIPEQVRRWGYYPDVSQWQAGDVVLTRSATPDAVSRQISAIQALGYGEEAASWTHAAVYLGDGLMLCEAQIDPPRACSVIIAKVWEYVGTHDLLVKRSRFAADVGSGSAIAIAAATKIGAAYDVPFILKMAASRAFLGDEVWLRDQASNVSAGSFVCSSLYSTAHAYVTNVSLTDKVNGLCVPAYLAQTLGRFLVEVPFEWFRIPPRS